MNTICLDLGTTAAKAAAFRGSRRIGGIVSQSTPLRTSGTAAQLDARRMIDLADSLIRAAGRTLGGQVDRIAIAAMSPAVCLLGKTDRPITPIICHLDRRSEREALEIAETFGEASLLKTTGNLPIPGGIASTILRWMQRNDAGRYHRATRVAPLTTLIVGHLTGRYICDPGTGTFLGVLDIRNMQPWRPMLRFLKLAPSSLPEIRDGGDVAGQVKANLMKKLGLRRRCEVLVGLMDTSAVCCHAGPGPGRMYNVVGTTDVLAICTRKARPQAGILSRPVGTGPHWLAISTMAAVGAALEWTYRTFFAELSRRKFYALADRLSVAKQEYEVTFDPDLAGSRMQVRQQYGQIRNLTLSTLREDILGALLHSLTKRSERRLQILRGQAKPDGVVFLAGGATRMGLQRLWPDIYRTVQLQEDASLRGLAQLAMTTIG